jgi:nucleoid-associated protein YgaU
MGFFEFMKGAGQKIGLFQNAAAEERAAPKEMAPTPEERAAKNAALAGALVEHVHGLGLEVADLAIEFRGGVATIRGSATQEVREKVVLAVGNVEGVGGVEDELTVIDPTPPARFHTVEKGDTLSALSKRYYGVLMLYDAIFEANKPMLKHPDEIFPGQVLRVPPLSEASYTVAKGDTLGAIAKRWYGDAKQYTRIFEANRDTLSSADAIDVGQTLRIPLDLAD